MKIGPTLRIFAFHGLCSLTALAATPDFEKQVAPILETHCLSCHDEHHAKGDVRLDLREHAIEIAEVSRVIAQRFPLDLLAESVCSSRGTAR